MSLDWDILIGILGFIFFIIVPAFTRKKQPPKKQQPGTPPATQKTAAPQQQRPAAPQQGRTASAAPTQQTPEPGSLAELLETIRQQVSEAQERETASSSAPKRTVAQPASADPVVVPPGPHSSQPAPLLSSPERRLRDLGTHADGARPQGLGRIRPQARRASVRTFTDTPDEEVVLAPALVQVDTSSVIQGMIWHEILSEPKGTRGMRRSKLPLR